MTCRSSEFCGIDGIALSNLYIVIIFYPHHNVLAYEVCIYLFHLYHFLNKLTVKNRNKQISMFSIKTYGKSEFAMMMFPDISDPKIAQNKLRRWIKLDPEFHQQIQR